MLFTYIQNQFTINRTVKSEVSTNHEPQVGRHAVGGCYGKLMVCLLTGELHVSTRTARYAGAVVVVVYNQTMTASMQVYSFTFVFCFHCFFPCLFEPGVEL